MKIRIKELTGKLVREADIHSFNHYQMLLHQLKSNQYMIEVMEGSLSKSRQIHVK